jgi:hypothetical protein
MVICESIATRVNNIFPSRLVLLVLLLSLNLALTSCATRNDINRKLDEIKVPELSGKFAGGYPLSEVLLMLKDISTTNDPGKVGVKFVVIEPGDPDFAKIADAVPAPDHWDPTIPVIEFNQPVSNLSLRQILDAICQVSDVPIGYYVVDEEVGFYLRRADHPIPVAMTAEMPRRSGLEAILRKLNQTTLPKLPPGLSQPVRLSKVLAILKNVSSSNGLPSDGINFLTKPYGDPAIYPTLINASSLSGGTEQPPFDPARITIKINSPVSNVTLLHLLDTICQSADVPVTYAVEDYAVWFSSKRNQ